jgi:uncharacterized membrane protein
MPFALSALAALAHAWAWWGGYGWPWPAVLWLGLILLFWGGLITLLVWAVRSSAAPRRAPETPLQVLRRRLATGEISEEEYVRIRARLSE